MDSRKVMLDLKLNKYVYIMAIPVLLFYILFNYLPIYGLVISFKEFSPGRGIWGSPWVGFKNFLDFFNGPYFFTILKNTVMISVLGIIWGFPAPIVLALLLNEVRCRLFKKINQTISYIPHFISLVVVCGIIIDFTSTNGVVNDLIAMFGLEKLNFLAKPEWFWTIYISTNIWADIGWGSIIYIAALSDINPEIYDAANIDGAGRWMQAVHVTLPSLTPMIIILFILCVGNIMNVGYEKIILLYNPLTYETADVISTYVYRMGLQDFNYSGSAAVGLFNSVINYTLLVLCNKFSQKISDTSLW